MRIAVDMPADCRLECTQQAQTKEHSTMCVMDERQVPGMQQPPQPTTTRSHSGCGRITARAVGCRKGVLSWNHPLTLLAVLVVLWTSGTFQHHLDTPVLSLSSSSGLCHARPWWSFPVACAQFARGQSRAHLRTPAAMEEELVNMTRDVSTDALRAINTKHQPPSKPKTLQQILSKAGNKALGGGIPGMVAGVVQV
jgi:hypothetical protein